MAAPPTWTNEETFKFIEIYQSEPTIWNPRNKFHKDKSKVNDAWNRIAEATGVPVLELKKKKETLLAAFRMNHKKRVASMKSGVDDVYKPIWCFYDALAAFMADVYECRSILNNECEMPSFQKQPDPNEEFDAPEEPPQMEQPSQSAPLGCSVSTTKRRNHKSSELAESTAHVKSALSMLSDVLKRDKSKTERDDDCELYGRLLAKKLRRYAADERQELMYEIDGLLLKRQMAVNGQSGFSDVSSPRMMSSDRPSPQSAHSDAYHRSSSRESSVTSPIQDSEQTNDTY